jgi:BirA family biotin operon repressor/biotin-[acetyl-CoA-carboxylase] ligase
MSERRVFDVQRFDQLDSTNRYLLDLARDGAPEGVVAVADFQSAGRGRLGRRWEAPAGSNLLASVLLRPVLDPDDLHLCTAAVALAALTGTEALTGVTAGIKWPNDLLVGDRKLAGVLAEADPGAPGGPAGSVAVVVGIGLNIGWAGPPGSDGTCLADLGATVERDPLLQALLEALGPRVDQLGSSEGLGVLADDLASRCTTLGRAVRIELAQETFLGRAMALTAQGHLVVETDQGPREVTAGDVVHLRTQAQPSPDAGPQCNGGSTRTN